jgi:KUP system potassium uptake protein
MTTNEAPPAGHDAPKSEAAPTSPTNEAAPLSRAAASPAAPPSAHAAAPTGAPHSTRAARAHATVSPHESHHHHAGGLLPLALGALGVVYGDIGTSPLYTLKECLAFAAEHSGHAPGSHDVLGLLSLIFWSLTLVVTVKYLVFIMRADNRGEGGIFALLAIVPERLRTGPALRVTWLSVLVVIGAALLYGDGAITPAISVLSAVEGLGIARPELAHYAVPITCVILIGLFAIQRKGTATVGKLFGPVMITWFGTLGALGAYHVARHPAVLAALSPTYAVGYLAHHAGRGWLILGSVVLAVTGGEALYADMGHFGAKPIRLSWIFLVKPALLLAYFGQGALVLTDPAAAKNPFFALVPKGPWTLALVVLSSAATVIASQALISGAFSLTRQAMQLGYFPRVTIKHTASEAEGQIYIPEVNLLLAVACLALVVSFRESSHLAAAYGIAVTGTMAITSIVFYVVTREVWGWSIAKALPLLVLFLGVDLAFLAANLFKFFEGGFVPVLIATAIIAAMLIWSRGRTLVVERYRQRFPRVEDAYSLVAARLAARVPGTGIFLGSSADYVPPALVQHVERNRALHEHVILLTVKTADVPYYEGERIETRDLPFGMRRVIVHYGFMEHPNVPAVLRAYCEPRGVPLDEKDTTYYLGREIILATDEGMMGSLAESVFAYLQRNTARADRHFNIPPAQVVEIGSQIDL